MPDSGMSAGTPERGTLRRFVCWIRGHRWEAVYPLVYEQSTTVAIVAGDPQTVPVTWVNDERCRCCGRESWWPS